ncbi:tRNA (adenosine(37)-N6)-threonylcarbamoyltransferase complex ATPase subunit type 1 TsaE [Mycoplasma sp. Ms02]|uniref:tRNA (adenosine(37)-N6)-threonylcarbamoyltransferase complex ATPase subunit type 1 TsaE n=1 Tax=Mycoplasma sp. Ms02 TaxID=353851 RepID=UPI0021062891|nr:tRNA (adenosine(37)-N6)-threonylcarbamoyltransferase complex ATPase subunit type 1 TsaE [Mycoplasma sp. Ms02]
MKTTLRAQNLNDLEFVAKSLLEILENRKFLLLSGELGSGKTTLVKSIGKELGIKENITSPSFGYMKVYHGLVHIDAYNMNFGLEEFEDYFDDSLVAIEWFENLPNKFQEYVKVTYKTRKQSKSLRNRKSIKWIFLLIQQMMIFIYRYSVTILLFTITHTWLVTRKRLI